MFIDILIVSLSTTVQLESLIRPICKLQRFSDLIAYLQTSNSRQILQTKEFCYYKPKTKHTVSLMITASGSVGH